MSRFIELAAQSGLDSVPDGTPNIIQAFDRAIARAAVEACAKEVEAAGCVCRQLSMYCDQHAVEIRWDLKEGEPHLDECPFALAAKLRGLAS